MSEKNTQGSKVLIFKRVAKGGSPAANVVSELNELLSVYARLIPLLRETDDEGLDIFTDSLVVLVVRCREALATGVDDKTGLELVKEMKDELRQFSRTLRSLLPGIGPRLGESIEWKLGIQFARYV